MLGGWSEILQFFAVDRSKSPISALLLPLGGSSCVTLVN